MTRVIMGWIDLAQDRDHFRDLGSRVIDFGFHKMLGRSCVPELI
jgi:hypothetical protein